MSIIKSLQPLWILNFLKMCQALWIVVGLKHLIFSQSCKNRKAIFKYRNVGLHKFSDINIVFVIPKRINCRFSETKPSKVNEELRLSVQQENIYGSSLVNDCVDESSKIDCAFTCMAGISGK